MHIPSAKSPVWPDSTFHDSVWLEIRNNHYQALWKVVTS